MREKCPTSDVLQTGVSQFAAGGEVEVLEFDQAGQDGQTRVWTEHTFRRFMR